MVESRRNDELIVIVGAGITGLTLAERFANDAKRKVLVIEKRDHIGGNCYDFINDKGVLVSKYGPHVFHSSNKKVWEYIKKFVKWEKYKHQVLSKVGKKLIPIPVNIETINLLFGTNLKNGWEMKKWLDKRRTKKIKKVKNSKEVVLKNLGPEIYKLMFRDYTKKQWGLWPEELSAEILARIPVRYSFDRSYNSDRYQMRPLGGFTKIFEKMVASQRIEIRLKTDFFKIYKSLPKRVKIIFTGPIDEYAFFMGKTNVKLPYRSIRFEWESHHANLYQQIGVINYPSLDDKELRSTEYKYLTGQRSDWTTLSREYFQWEGEPYYPVINAKNLKKYQKIVKESKEWRNTYFAGRLGKYKYLDMDDAVKEALELYEEISFGNRKIIRHIFKKFSGFLKSLILIFFSLVLSLIFIEILLGFLKYKNIAHDWQLEMTSKDVGHVANTERIYAINKSLYQDGGFRFNPDHHNFADFSNPLIKKIVVLGDSATFGVGVSMDQTFPFFLERQLRKDGWKDFLVHNAGVSGYGVDQEFVYLESEILPEVRPEVVVWAINVNDVFDSNGACLFKKDGDTFKQVSGSKNFLYMQAIANRKLPRFFLDSKIYNLLISTVSKKFTGSLHDNRFTPGCTMMNMEDEKMVDEHIYQKIKYLLSKADELSNKYNTKIILSLIPFQSYFDKKNMNDSFGYYYKKIVDVLSSSNFSFVDMNEELLKRIDDEDFLKYRTKKTTYFKNNGKEWNKILFMGDSDLTIEGWKHPNSVAYKLMADVLAEKINESKK